jgi:hypothetical protein
MRWAVAKPSQKATKLQMLASAVVLASANVLKMRLAKVIRMSSTPFIACIADVAKSFVPLRL